MRYEEGRRSSRYRSRQYRRQEGINRHNPMVQKDIISSHQVGDYEMSDLFE